MFQIKMICDKPNDRGDSFSFWQSHTIGEAAAIAEDLKHLWGYARKRDRQDD